MGKRLAALGVMAVAGVASAQTATITIPAALEPVGLFNSVMAASGTILATAVGVGAVVGIIVGVAKFLRRAPAHASGGRR